MATTILINLSKDTWNLLKDNKVIENNDNFASAMPDDTTWRRVSGVKTKLVKGFRARVFTNNVYFTNNLRFDCVFDIQWQYNGSYINFAKVIIDETSKYRNTGDNVTVNVTTEGPYNSGTDENIVAKLGLSISINCHNSSLGGTWVDDSGWNCTIYIFGDGTYEMGDCDNHIGPDNIDKVGHCTTNRDCEGQDGCVCARGDTCNINPNDDVYDKKNWFCKTAVNPSNYVHCECNWDKYADKYENAIKPRETYENFDFFLPDGSLTVDSKYIIVLLIIAILVLLYFIIKKINNEI
jgi:hypothetical protein